MTWAERVFHAVLFELGAIGVSTVAVLAFSSTEAATAIGAGVVMAMMAMVWNFVFNFFFDKVFTGKREERSVRLRVFHTLAFEFGLVVFTVPVLAWMLGISLWHAFLADIGLTLLITVYAFFFNWTFDLVRARYLAQRQAQATRIGGGRP